VPPSDDRQKPWLTSAVGSAPASRSASEKRRPASGLTRRTSKKAPETTATVAETGVDPPVIDWTLEEYAARPSRVWFWAARSSKFGSDIWRMRRPLASTWKTATTRSLSGNASGRRSTSYTTEKIAVVAPIPRVRARAARTVVPRLRAR
jgi:hypothetical protein